MKPKNTLKINVPLPGDWQAYDAKFRAHLAEAAKNLLLSRLTEDWVDNQQITHLQLIEKERRRKVEEKINQLRLQKKAEKTSQQSPTAGKASEKAETPEASTDTGKSRAASAEGAKEQEGAATKAANSSEQSQSQSQSQSKEAPVATGNKFD